VDDAVTDSPQADCIKINAGSGKIVLHRLHSRGVISNWTTCFTDTLDDALGLHLGSLRHQQLILQR
jgi:hypothetical protein